MSVVSGGLFRMVSRSVTIVVLAVGGIAGVYFAANKPTSASTQGEETAKASSAQAKSADARIQRTATDELLVPDEIAKLVGLSVETVEPVTRPIRLPSLQGVLALDSDRLSRVHTRFNGELVELGSHECAVTGPRSVTVGDTVKKGDLLAVVWSKELGEKKSDYIGSLTSLRAQELLLSKLKKLVDDGAIPSRNYRDAEKDVQMTRIEADKAERTLRTWRLSDADLAELRTEAERGLQAKPDGASQKDWARVEIRAPRDGVILEKNVAVGDMVDTNDDLFKIGDLSRLAVWVHVFEEDLNLIEALPRPVRWKVSLPCRQGTCFAGTLEKIGSVIEPTQHTALVSGFVDNAHGELKAGQFVTVSVELPAPVGEIALPTRAVVEDGHESIVFVQPNADQNRFVRKSVDVVRRFRDVIYVREASSGVHPGNRVLTSGAIMLRNTLEQLPVVAVAASEGVRSSATN